MALAQAPSIPAAANVSMEAKAHFQSLKGELGHIVSWNLSPNSWDRIQIKYAEKGTEEQARAMVGAVSIKDSVG